MVYSKLLKPHHYTLSSRLNKVNYVCNNVKPYLLRNQIKISSNVYSGHSNFSTLMCLKLRDQSKLALNSHVLHLHSAASISTDINSDKYHIVIVNPKESSTTLDSSLGPVVDGTKDPEVLSLPVTDSLDATTSLSDIATSLPNELASAVNIIEPSFASIDLAHWTPSGVVQMFLEYLHINMHWPWWVTIISCTVIARILLLPLLIKTQKNAINMSNNMPQLQYLQMKFGEARKCGNSLEASRLASEMMAFVKEKNIHPLKNSILPLLQAPVFLSFFFALRGMAKAPVESMKFGGLSWVYDLTIPDPYYILPVVSCATFYIILRVGAESGMRMDNMKLAKYVLSALPIIVLPFCINFPAAILYYWCTNNFCTLMFVSVLKVDSVRKYFNLPKQQPIDPNIVLPKKKFMEGMKDAFEDQKVLANIEDRRRIDDMNFQKAGTGPIPRTYSYDPTKPRPSAAASIANKIISAKERKV